MLLYWYRLENLGKEFPLLKEAYNETKLLYLSKKLTWYESVLIFGFSDSRSVFNLKNAFRDF
jgi:hypothetical protein